MNAGFSGRGAPGLERIEVHRIVVARDSSKLLLVFFSSRRRHTTCLIDWSSDVCSSDLRASAAPASARQAWNSGSPHAASRSRRQEMARANAATQLHNGMAARSEEHT